MAQRLAVVGIDELLPHATVGLDVVHVRGDLDAPSTVAVNTERAFTEDAGPKPLPLGALVPLPDFGVRTVLWAPVCLAAP